VAGTGAPGYAGDNGPATQARLDYPLGLAFDGAGSLYIADSFNYRVRKVSPDGTITTVAGTGKPGFAGDGGKATAAQLNTPKFLAVDGAGDLFISDYYNLFIADFGNNRVRKVAPDGIITTAAGVGGNGGFSGDNGPATDARLNDPIGLAVDALGNLFIAEKGNYRVRKVSPEGVITTVAGSGKNQPYAGDGGLATDTGLRGPAGLAIDAVGNLLFSDFPYPREAPYDERVLKVFGVAAPGLLAGMAFPMPKQP
jgi:sugar lactone lactonase YvrE